MSNNRSNFIHGLWDELADFGADRSDQALVHLMEGLCALTGTWNITWMETVRLDTSAARQESSSPQKR